MITRLAINGYRSLRNIVLELGPLNVVTGANGSGKSSLYRALKLLADIAQGRIIQSLAAEGGLQSTLWAGPEKISRTMKTGIHPIEGTVRKNPIALKLGFSGEDYGYAVDLGPPVHGSTPFANDPDIKVECVWTGEVWNRASMFAERRGPHVRVRSETGEWREVTTELASTDSMLSHCTDPREAPELLSLRERMRLWRFYDQWRTDREAPARRPQIGTHTPVLADDGSDIAAAVQTIMHIGNPDAFREAIADAFPGARIGVGGSNNYLEIEMQQHGLLRPLQISELSDGTLRYLFLAAALLTPRPPELMVLNEPEASLHPDLLAPLARLIARIAARSQIIVVSHSETLVSALEGECRLIVLEKEFGETHPRDADAPAWTWPPR